MTTHPFATNTAHGVPSARPDHAALERLADMCTKRLRYAHFKVQNGWAQQTLSEVENLCLKQPSSKSRDAAFGPFTAVGAGDFTFVSPFASTPISQSQNSSRNLYPQDTSRLAPISLAAPPRSNRVLLPKSFPMCTPPRRVRGQFDKMAYIPVSSGLRASDTFIASSKASEGPWSRPRHQDGVGNSPKEGVSNYRAFLTPISPGFDSSTPAPRKRLVNYTIEAQEQEPRFKRFRMVHA